MKCQICEKEETYPEVDMFKELKPNTTNRYRYWHYECFEIEKKDREFKKIESDELDELWELIREIHSLNAIKGTKKIFNELFCLIQDLRNGTERFMNYQYHYKKGFKYSVIKKSYEMNRKKIEFYRRNKQFKDTKAELKYCFMIVRNNIMNAFKEMKRLEKVDNTYVNPHHSYSEFNVEPSKKFPKK